jgi:outer membrane protein TolC
LLLLLVLTFARAATAQEILGFDEAMQRVQGQNLDLRAAQQRIVQALTEVHKAEANLWPVGSLLLKYTRNGVAAELRSPDGIQTLQPLNQLDIVAGVRAPLFVPWAYAARAATRDGVQVASAEYRAQSAALLMAAAGLFYAAVGADELVAARERALRMAQSVLSLAQQRFEAGAVGRADLARAELALLKAQQRSLEAAQQRHAAYRALATLMQFDGPFRLFVAPDATSSAADEAPPRERALDARPDVLALRYRLRAAELQIESERMRWAPTLAAAAEIREFNYAGYSTQDRHAWKVDVQLEWQFMDGGIRSARLSAAQSNARELRLRLAALEANVRTELDDATDAVRTTARVMETLARTVQLAREALDVVWAQYQTGSVSQLELLEAQEASIDADVALAQTRFRLALARIELRKAAGAFPVNDARRQTRPRLHPG